MVIFYSTMFFIKVSNKTRVLALYTISRRWQKKGNKTRILTQNKTRSKRPLTTSQKFTIEACQNNNPKPNSRVGRHTLKPRGLWGAKRLPLSPVTNNSLDNTTIRYIKRRIKRGGPHRVFVHNNNRLLQNSI